MSAIVSKTARKILPVLLENPLREFKEIELITSAGTGKGSAAALINTLTKEGLLRERRAGKTKLISLSLVNPAVFWIKNLLDYDKLKHFSRIRLATALYFAMESSASLVILFGSTVAGTASKESDIDLLIVSQELKAVEKARKEAGELFNQRLNLHIYSRKEIADKIRDDSFIRNALITGVILQGHDLAKSLYSGMAEKKKKSLGRLHYFRERIAAAERNYRQDDHTAAQEILSTLQEQLIFYLLSEKGISYSSKKDAARAILKLPEGNIFKTLEKKPLKKKISILGILLEKKLINALLETVGYELIGRD